MSINLNAPFPAFFISFHPFMHLISYMDCLNTGLNFQKQDCPMVFVLQHQCVVGFMLTPRDFLHGDTAPNNYEIVHEDVFLQFILAYFR